MKSKYIYKVGFSQTEPILNSLETNCIEILKRINNKTEYDILVFPELATCGYDYSDKTLLKRNSLRADSSFFNDVKMLCMKRHSAVVIGFAEQEAGRLYNSSLMINEKGQYTLYRKTHLFFNEFNIFSKGNTGFTIGETNGMKVGQMICFDWFFPEAARTIMLRKADLIAHPANLVMEYCQNAMKIRTLENRIYAITANREGKEGDFEFTGKSQITAFDGKVLKRARRNNITTMYCDIDVRNSRNKKLNSVNNILNNRRKDCYEQ